MALSLASYNVSTDGLTVTLVLAGGTAPYDDAAANWGVAQSFFDPLNPTDLSSRCGHTQSIAASIAGDTVTITLSSSFPVFAGSPLWVDYPDLTDAAAGSFPADTFAELSGSNNSTVSVDATAPVLTVTPGGTIGEATISWPAPSDPLVEQTDLYKNGAFEVTVYLPDTTYAVLDTLDGDVWTGYYVADCGWGSGVSGDTPLCVAPTVGTIGIF